MGRSMNEGRREVEVGSRRSFGGPDDWPGV